MENPESPKELSSVKNPGFKFDSMRDPGFHIGKLDTQTLNVLSDFGMKVENSKDDKGNGIVRMNSDLKFSIIFIENGKLQTQAPVMMQLDIDNDTAKIESATTIINGQKVLGVKIINKNGTTDQAIFGPK